MKKQSFVLLACLLAATASSQWLETTIQLPDSLSGLNTTTSIVYNPTNNRVCVAGSDGVVIVYDAATRAKVGRIVAPPNVFAMCLNSQENRLYAACRDSIYVLDCDSGRVTARLAEAGYNGAVVWNPGVNRVYVANSTYNEVVVIDCGPDTIRARIPTAVDPVALAVSPAHNKVYCALPWGGSTPLAVIDAVGDSVLRWITIGYRDIEELLYNPASDRLFCPDYDNGLLITVDCARDSVLREAMLADDLRGMCLDTRDNKLYFGGWFDHYPVVYVFSGSQGTFIDMLRVPDRVSATVYDSARNVVFCGTTEDTMAVVDCATDSLVDAIALGGAAEAVCMDPGTGTVYAGTNGMFVIDAPSRQVVSYDPLAMAPFLLCAVPDLDKLYCADRHRRALAVIDVAGNCVSLVARTESPMTDMQYCPVLHKLYASGSFPDRVDVFDCRGDTLLRSIPMPVGPGRLAYSPRQNRLYVAADYDGDMQVVDCGADSIVATVTTGSALAMEYEPADDRVYCGTDYPGAVVAVDCSSNTVMATVNVGGEVSALRYVPLGNIMACVVYDAQAVLALSCASNEVTDVAPIYGESEVLEYNPLWNKLYCALAGTWLVSVVECAEWRHVRTVVAGNEPIALMVDTIADKLYCANWEAGTVSVIRSRGDRLAGTVRVGVNPADIAWFPMQRRVYVANEGSSSISVIRDTTLVGIAGPQPAAVGNWKPATVVRDVLFAPSSSFNTRHSLFSLSGRKVLDLRRGANDVRHLSPGVYLVRTADGEQRMAVQKVVIIQ